MLLFRSEAHIDRWCGARDLERGGTMTPEQCWRLADAWYRDRAKSSYRRRTADEAQELFTSLGLTGPFWQLREKRS